MGEFSTDCSTEHIFLVHAGECSDYLFVSGYALDFVNLGLLC